MNVKIVLFSKRLYNFNISKDLSHFVIQNRKLYIGCLQDDRLIEVKKDNDIYLSTFSDDNSSVVIKDYKKLFYLCDNFNKEINIDPNKINQIMVIILDNAIKYTAQNDKIEIKTYSKDGKCIIEIADTRNRNK